MLKPFRDRIHADYRNVQKFYSSFSFLLSHFVHVVTFIANVQNICNLIGRDECNFSRIVFSTSIVYCLTKKHNKIWFPCQKKKLFNQKQIHNYWLIKNVLDIINWLLNINKLLCKNENLFLCDFLLPLINDELTESSYFVR